MDIFILIVILGVWILLYILMIKHIYKVDNYNPKFNQQSPYNKGTTYTFYKPRVKRKPTITFFGRFNGKNEESTSVLKAQKPKKGNIINRF